MKRINLLIILIASLIVLVSCNDILNTKPLNKLTTNNVWNNESTAKQFILGTYAKVIGGLYYIYRDQTDDWTNNDFVEVNSPKDIKVNTGSITKFFNAGWNKYGIIRRTNLIIHKVQNSKNISDKDKKKMIAEGKFLRAMTYYYLAQRFGGVMLVDSVLSVDDNFKLPRSSTKETYDFIINDLKDAAKGLPVNAPTGKATKAAAYAMITRVALQAAAYVPKNKHHYYVLVKNAAKKVFGYGYSLDPNYEKLFNNYEYAQNANGIILGLFLSKQNTVYRDTPMQRMAANNSDSKAYSWITPKIKNSVEGWLHRGPSQNLAAAYLSIDRDGKAKPWNQTSYYKDWLKNGGYVSHFLYRHRDKRFYASIVYDSSMYYVNLAMMRKGGKFLSNLPTTKPLICD